MPLVGFEPTILVFERENTVNALDASIIFGFWGRLQCYTLPF
jgi:hypothetical protein